MSKEEVWAMLQNAKLLKHKILIGLLYEPGGDFDNRYSQRGVQWAVKKVARAAGVKKEVHTHALRHSYATHLLEDGMDIMTLKDLFGHQKTENTREYLQIAQLESKQKFSSPDTLFYQMSLL